MWEWRETVVVVVKSRKDPTIESSPSNLHSSSSLFKFARSAVWICMMMSGPMLMRRFTWHGVAPLKKHWRPINGVNKQDNGKDHSRLPNGNSLMLDSNLIVKRFWNNETWVHTFYFDIKPSRWWMMTTKRQLNAKKCELNNELTILINLSPTRPLSDYLKRHWLRSLPRSYRESLSEFIKSQSWMNQINSRAGLRCFFSLSLFSSAHAQLARRKTFAIWLVASRLVINQ